MAFIVLYFVCVNEALFVEFVGRYITGKAFGKALKIGKGKTVCVTGASGFIASHCVQQLLATGYTVHGTVRSLENREKVAHLESLPFAATRLKLFEADLLVDGSFDAAVAGCDAVLHTASPFSTDSSLTEEDFCRPAVEGTLNVLNSLKRAGVKICVLTSSTAAVYCYTQGAGLRNCLRLRCARTTASLFHPIMTLPIMSFIFFCQALITCTRILIGVMLVL